MIRKIHRAFPALVTIAAAFSIGLAWQVVAVANTATAETGQAMADVTIEAVCKDSKAAKRRTVTLEQIRAAMAEAEQRRLALLNPDPMIADPALRQAMLEKWGVEVYGVRQAAKGYMMDFRFRVVDAEKALPLFDPRIKPYVLTEGAQIKLPVPSGAKVGSFRTTNRGKNITADKDYYMMFGNPDAYVKPGQKVSVVIGDFRVDELTLR